ncbi:MAG: hypothetical protein JXK93_12625 [Sphaerochaetaceae bacterium]|nr:hypothetical protein [Sphaerochaetaceae bacterium]
MKPRRAGQAQEMKKREKESEVLTVRAYRSHQDSKTLHSSHLKKQATDRYS